MQIRGTDRLDGLGPLHGAPEITATQRSAAGAGEDQRIMIPPGVSSKMLTNLRDDHCGHHNGASASPRFRRPDNQCVGVELDMLSPYGHCPGIGINVAAAQSGHLAPTQASKRGKKDQNAKRRSWTRSARFST